MRELKPNERTFNIRPVGIKYICELCGEGEQVVDSNQAITVPLGGNSKPMIPHHCTKCGGKMMLPRTYPYVEWVTEDENETT